MALPVTPRYTPLIGDSLISVGIENKGVVGFEVGSRLEDVYPLNTRTPQPTVFLT
jgi:hypothetical protein